MSAAKHSKVIVVLGATGAQGGGVCHALLSSGSPQFAVRAVTRDPSSAAAKALAEKGAEVVFGHHGDEASLAKAFAGAYGLFAVTPLTSNSEQETADAQAIARQAKAAGLQHVIWSTLEDTRTFMALDDPRMPTLQGKYKVPHFDAKGEANKYFVEAGVPTTFLLTSFYWNNFIKFGMGPRKTGDGGLTLALPLGDRPLPGIAAEDIGGCAYGIFAKGPKEMAGQTLGIAGEHLTGAQMAAILGKHLGKPCTYVDVPFDQFRALPMPMAAELGNMFKFFHDFNKEFCARRDVGYARKLNPGLLTFDGFVTKYSNTIPILESSEAPKKSPSI